LISGGMIFVQIFIDLSAKGTSNGTATIDLPLTAKNRNQAISCLVITNAANLVGVGGAPVVTVLHNTKLAYPGEWGATGTAGWDESNFSDTTIIYVSGWYEYA